LHLLAATLRSGAISCDSTRARFNRKIEYPQLGIV
jgi:hypothetical protein